MPYRFREDIAIADVAFEAWGNSLEEMFRAAADATLNVMIEDIDSLARKEKRVVRVEGEDLELILFDFLQELIYYKDADYLLLRVLRLNLIKNQGRWSLEADLGGEAIDPKKHRLLVDVKAVTLHRFQVEETPEGWQAKVILDI